MKTSIFSVFDSKLAVYNTPFFMQREQAAIRSFTDAVNDPQTTLNKHPEDYTLFHIGDFDDDTGELIPVHPRGLITASAVVRPAGLSNGAGGVVSVEK